MCVHACMLEVEFVCVYIHAYGGDYLLCLMLLIMKSTPSSGVSLGFMVFIGISVRLVFWVGFNGSAALH